MPKIVGIDLGTTNSLVAFVEAGQPVVITSAEGSELVPSIVGFSKSGERLVGDLAKRQAISNPERTTTIISIKRHMGTDFKAQIDDKVYTPQEISAMILQKMKADAEAFLGEAVEKAVITVPAYFNDSERQATKDAGTIAGLEVVRIINEPTAAAIAYGLDKQQELLKILVFDLGGGTFDVSVLEIGEGTYQVISTCGDMRLGGDDWDQRIMDYLVDEFKKQNSIDLRIDRVAMQRLKDAAEQAKKELSTETATTVNLPFLAADASGPKHLEMELTRARFEELTKDLVERLKGPFDKALADSGLRLGQIQKVILVGGCTRMPMVQAFAKKISGKEPTRDVDPDKVVSMGAAIQGGVLAGEVKDMVLLDVTSLSMGIETAGGVFTRIIERNSQIPISKQKVFTTAADGQTTVEVHVLQGERDLAAHNRSLGRFELKNIPPSPKGIPQIEVAFEIDANGILNVSARDRATNNKQKITIQSPTNLTPEEIDRMVKEAQTYQEEDAKLKVERQARTLADQEIESAEKLLREHGSRFATDKLQRVRDVIERLRAVLEALDEERTIEYTKVLKGLVYNLSSEMYAQPAEPEAAPMSGGAPPPGVSDSGDEEILSWFQK
ncbi:MAG: molecular chaperone DnaK [Armatimonadetes bacterium]|nr:molecular chaperone DnaK [Armatimonadota bacterium]